MFVIEAPQCKASLVASLICKCTVLDLWRIAPHCHHTQPKIHEIHSNCGGYVNNFVLLVACESSNWLLQKLQFSFGLLEIDTVSKKSLSFSFKNSSWDFFFCFLNSRTYVADCREMAQWARNIRIWICTLGVLWKLRYGYVQPEPWCFGGGVVTGASERLASQIISENTSSKFNDRPCLKI